MFLARWLTLNPSARGVLFTTGTGGATLTRIGNGSAAKWALKVTGSLRLLGIGGVAIVKKDTATDVDGEFRFNTTGTNVGGFINGSEVMDVQVGGVDGLDLTVSGQKLSAVSATITRFTTATARTPSPPRSTTPVSTSPPAQPTRSSP